MSHDNRIYVNTTQNNLVVIDSEHNQLTVTHPITQVIEITQSPRPTIIVTEETPNNELKAIAELIQTLRLLKHLPDPFKYRLII